VIENKRMRTRASKPGAKKRKSGVTRKPPPGYVGWNEETFERLIERAPEPLMSRFRVTHGMLLLLLRQAEDDADPRRGWRAVAELVGRSHESDAASGAFCAMLRSCSGAARGHHPRRARPADGLAACARGDLQWDFSLHHARSTWSRRSVHRGARRSVRSRGALARRSGARRSARDPVSPARPD
jgi:hypothetical protein